MGFNTYLKPRNYQLTNAITAVKNAKPWRKGVPGRPFENRSYAKIRAKVTLPKLPQASDG